MAAAQGTDPAHPDQAHPDQAAQDRVNPGSSELCRAGERVRAEQNADSATAAAHTEREIQRLRWQCRRGMLELDLLLNHFLDQGYAELDRDGRQAFERLLGMQDQILQDWLFGQAVPADAEIGALISRIQTAIRPTSC